MRHQYLLFLVEDFLEFINGDGSIDELCDMKGCLKLLGSVGKCLLEDPELSTKYLIPTLWAIMADIM